MIHHHLSTPINQNKIPWIWHPIDRSPSTTSLKSDKSKNWFDFSPSLGLGTAVFPVSQTGKPKLSCILAINPFFQGQMSSGRCWSLAQVELTGCCWSLLDFQPVAALLPPITMSELSRNWKVLEHTSHPWTGRFVTRRNPNSQLRATNSPRVIYLAGTGSRNVALDNPIPVATLKASIQWAKSPPLG